MYFCSLNFTVSSILLKGVGLKPNVHSCILKLYTTAGLRRNVPDGLETVTLETTIATYEHICFGYVQSDIAGPDERTEVQNARHHACMKSTKWNACQESLQIHRSQSFRRTRTETTSKLTNTKEGSFKCAAWSRTLCTTTDHVETWGEPSLKNDLGLG